MPTCYTADVESGKITTLADYARTCAKAFMWDYRDSLPFDAPLPTASTFRDSLIAGHEKHERETLDAIYALEGMTDAQCEAKAKEEHAQLAADAKRINERAVLEAARYEDMTNQVRRWEAPAPLAGLREFMLEQLAISSRGNGYTWPEPPPPKSATEWRAASREHLHQRLERARADAQKQRDNKALEQTWLDALHTELARMASA